MTGESAQFPDFFLYRALPKNLRVLDTTEGRRFLWLLMRGCQNYADQIRDKIAVDLPKTDDPLTCPADLLPYLVRQLGFVGPAAHLLDGRSERDLRRLALVAVPMWKQRGTPAGLLAMVQSLTGRTAAYFDWFYMRALLEEGAVAEEQLGGDLAVVGGTDSYNDAFVSDLVLQDDGTLDEELLLELVSLCRPLNETVEILLLDFYDRFESSLSKTKWQSVGATPFAIDEESQSLLLGYGCNLDALIPIAPSSAFSNYVVALKWTPTNSPVLRVKLFIGGTVEAPTYVYVDFDIPNQRVKIGHKDGAGIEWDDAYLPFPLEVVSGVPYGVRVEAMPRASGPEVRVYLDSTFAGSYEYTDGARSGKFGVFGLGAGTSHSSLLDNVQCSRLPYRQARVRPAGITMTPNFVQ